MGYLAVFVSGADGGGELTVALVGAQGEAWIGGNSALTEGEVAEFRARFDRAGARGFRYAIAGDRPLLESSHDPDRTGEPWGWDRCLDACGLAMA